MRYFIFLLMFSALGCSARNTSISVAITPFSVSVSGRAEKIDLDKNILAGGLTRFRQ